MTKIYTICPGCENDYNETHILDGLEEFMCFVCGIAWNVHTGKQIKDPHRSDYDPECEPEYEETEEQELQCPS